MYQDNRRLDFHALGKEKKKKREAKGWTQEQLTAKMQLTGCDLTRSALAKIEVGQRSVYPDEIKALLEVFRISAEELLP